MKYNIYCTAGSAIINKYYVIDDFLGEDYGAIGVFNKSVVKCIKPYPINEFINIKGRKFRLSNNILLKVKYKPKNFKL